jgi:GTP-binding protein
MMMAGLKTAEELKADLAMAAKLEELKGFEQWAVKEFREKAVGFKRIAAPTMMASAVAERDNLRNIAIVAHVDHGKTTLVDAMLESASAISGKKEIGKDERMMDNNDQERERGITILAKNAALTYEGTKVNIVDTPGHADFGGEVERVLGMVDGVLLLVDAQEGPKPQTRFVLKKALALGLKVLVVVNKIDKPAARPSYVVDKTFDLFCELGASDEQTDFPIVYCSAINRVAGFEPDAIGEDMSAIFKRIMELPKPEATVDGPLQLQISNVAADSFIGRLGIGRIKSGTLKKNTPIGRSAGPGTEVKPAKVSEMFGFDAMGRVAIDEASAGDIVIMSGLGDFDIGNTLVDLDDPQPLEPIEVEQPTMSITFGVNKSPFGGRVGKLLTSRNIRDRLAKELETNVALRVEDTEDGDTVLVSGRGLLHLTVLIETMRREGFELMVGCPTVINQEVNGQQMEPFELVDMEMPEEYTGSAIDLLNQRKGSMVEMGPPTKEGLVNLIYEVPSRGMNGVKSKLLSASRGLCVLSTTFTGYRKYAGDFGGRDRGNLLSFETGTVTPFSVGKIQERGALFSKPGDEVYEDQIIGINAKEGDLKVNVCKAKALTNMRSAGADDKANVVPAMQLTLEDAVEYIQAGEFVEVTPDAVRMGKIPGKKNPSR